MGGQTLHSRLNPTDHFTMFLRAFLLHAVSLRLTHSQPPLPLYGGFIRSSDDMHKFAAARANDMKVIPFHAPCGVVAEPGMKDILIPRKNRVDPHLPDFFAQNNVCTWLLRDLSLQAVMICIATNAISNI